MKYKNSKLSKIKFSDFSLNSNILRSIKDLKFKNPTPIQCKVIPHLKSSNQDLIAIAQTGTGKTAAFGLPLLDLTDILNSRTQFLILCPTRELCIQIANDLNTYSKYISGLNVVPIYGGSRIELQIKALKKGAQIVVGTPGRAKDLIKRKRLFLSNVVRVVIDEADEMLSMGFKEDLEFILGKTNKDKQILLFSATITKKIRDITINYMKDPHEITVSRSNIAADNVEHIFYQVHVKDRYEVLKRLVDINQDIYGIVFCRTRNDTKNIASKLMSDNYNADTLHGDLTQSQRDDVMSRFRKKHIQILVATDVAARGLDIVNLTHIINYNLPDDGEVYIHRSGRTGRAGNKGISIAIVCGREIRKIKEIESKSNIVFTKKLVPSGDQICKERLFAYVEKILYVNVKERQIRPFLSEVMKKLNSLNREQLIKHFVSTEFNRYLSYYKNSKDINLSVKSDSNVKKNQRSKKNRSKYRNKLIKRKSRNRNRIKRRK